AVADGLQRRGGPTPRAGAAVVADPVLDVGVDLAGDPARAGGGSRRGTAASAAGGPGIHCRAAGAGDLGAQIAAGAGRLVATELAPRGGGRGQAQAGDGDEREDPAVHESSVVPSRRDDKSLILLNKARFSPACDGVQGIANWCPGEARAYTSAPGAESPPPTRTQPDDHRYRRAPRRQALHPDPRLPDERVRLVADGRRARRLRRAGTDRRPGR